MVWLVAEAPVANGSHLQRRSTTVAGRPAFYGEAGEGPAVVFLHGWGLAQYSYKLTLTATFDHRYVDGFHAAAFGHAAVEYCKNPAAFEPPFAKGTANPLTATAPTPPVAALRTASHA